MSICLDRSREFAVELIDLCYNGAGEWSFRIVSPVGTAQGVGGSNPRTLDFGRGLLEGRRDKNKGLGTEENGEGEMAEGHNDGSSGGWPREEIAGPAVWRVVYGRSVYYANTGC